MKNSTYQRAAQIKYYRQREAEEWGHAAGATDARVREVHAELAVSYGSLSVEPARKRALPVDGKAPERIFQTDDTSMFSDLIEQLDLIQTDVGRHGSRGQD